MQQKKPPSIAQLLASHRDRTDIAISDDKHRICPDAARGTTCLLADMPDPEGRSILLATPDQLTTALALIELDGFARRLVLCPPDIDSSQLKSIVATAEADLIVSGANASCFDGYGLPIVRTTPCLTPRPLCNSSSIRTEWVLLTSGTTSTPKLVQHDLASLIAPISMPFNTSDTTTVWATFYDIRRYGGLQIFLRAMVGGASMILSSAGEAIEDHLRRLCANNVTHISGTPSHWRRVLMSGAANAISPRYIRLSGEIADQGILDALHKAYPDADISHAYATTEAGVGFNVIDGREGFPASFVNDGDRDDGVTVRVDQGTLRLRSPRTAARYLGLSQPPIRDGEDFVDTGDQVELRDGRYIFMGRRGGIINVGGQKVHPEEIEMTINRHPAVQVSMVYARRSPITGALVVADVMVKQSSPSTASDALANDILSYCRQTLRPYKVPTRIRFVTHLDVAPSGKLARPNA